MYNPNFGFSCSPFENTLDQRFLFFSECHEEVIEALLYFVKEKKSFASGWKTQLGIFELYGCHYKRKEGSHHILICPGAKRVVVIPEYDDIDVDIIKSNMRTAGMTRDQYFELLKMV
jgi:predicted RNA binding protein YcfA (HicA-like mRNA interferase family)